MILLKSAKTFSASCSADNNLRFPAFIASLGIAEVFAPHMSVPEAAVNKDDGFVFG